MGNSDLGKQKHFPHPFDTFLGGEDTAQMSIPILRMLCEVKDPFVDLLYLIYSIILPC
jgi:hypothetical protein